MSFSGPADNFSNLLRRNQAFSPSKIYDVIRFHLNEVYSSSSGEANKVHTLYQQYYPFIVMGLNNIRNAIEEVSHSEPCELLKTYDLLLRCLKNLKPWLNWSVLSEHWGTYIKSLMVCNDISTTRKEIRAYMEFLGIEKHHCIVPVYNVELDKSLLTNTLDILLVYIYCLSQSCNTQDARELFSVIQKLDPWMKDLDGDDMKRRSLLVEHLIETINYHDDDLAAEHMAVILLEHNKVCKDARMLELGLAFVRKAIWGKKGFLRRVIGHLDRQCQCQVAIHRFPNMNVWVANLMQLQSHSGRLHPTIFITIQSLRLEGHTKDILCDKGDSLLKSMTLIANARVEREKGVHGLDSCLANLDNAIDSLHKCKVKANDLCSLYFLQAQALCLRALSRYENCNSKKNFTEDIEKVLKLVTNTYFSELAAKLTTSSDVDLNDFVSKFYTQLQPHTILVINILGDKYKKLLWKLPFYVPCEHVSFLMISRFSSTRIPLFYLFQVNSKGSGRPGELWKAPWGTDTIVDTILPDFKWIVKDFEDGIFAGTLDGRISNIIYHMEGWFGQHEDILLGEPMDNQKNQKINKSGRFTRIGVNNASLPLFPSPTTKRKPVIILVHYKVIQESMKELENQYIYRMPSVSSIFYTYQICYKIQRKAVRDYASYATLDPFDAYYGEYCSRHIPIDAFAKLDKCASAILMGCYSGLLELEVPYIPKGALIDYVLAGSPIVVGNLWVVRQTWVLEFTKKLLKTFEGELEDEAGIVAYLDLARKTYNNLMYIAGTICYGLPTLLRKIIP
ncbi:separase [Tanacetum coccineum]